MRILDIVHILQNQFNSRLHGCTFTLKGCTAGPLLRQHFHCPIRVRRGLVLKKKRNSKDFTLLIFVLIILLIIIIIIKYLLLLIIINITTFKPEVLILLVPQASLRRVMGLCRNYNSKVYGSCVTPPDTVRHNKMNVLFKPLWGYMMQGLAITWTVIECGPKGRSCHAWLASALAAVLPLGGTNQPHANWFLFF